MTALQEEGPAGAAMLDRLTEDPLVESLLLLHDLHPLDVDARIQRALDQVRPYLGSHAGRCGVPRRVRRGGAAAARGQLPWLPVVHGHGAAGHQGAVQDAAPEVTEVVVEGMTTPPPAAPLLQIGRRPEDDALAATGNPAGTGDVGWVTLPNIGPPSSRPVTATAGDTTVLVCSVRGTLYAYRDACAACGRSLADGTLDREKLTCGGCGSRYDVRLAGKGLDDPALHLDPLPLLTDSQGIRVAIPETAPS